MKKKGGAECRRGENRDAGAEEGGSKRGISPYPWRRGLGGDCIPPHIFSFLSGNDAFWCILGACFNVTIRHVSKSRFVCQLVSYAPTRTCRDVIIAYMHERRKQAKQLYNRRTAMENQLTIRVRYRI